MAYAHPEALVETEWVERHRSRRDVRLVEVDVDAYSYDEGHIAGALSWSWTHDLCDPVLRDILNAEQLEALLDRAGIANDTTVVLYGDNNNWFAAWAFWLLRVYGHRDVRLMNGGRRKWVAEGRALVTAPSEAAPSRGYRACAADTSLRAFLPEVQRAMNGAAALIDVRTPAEFRGDILAPPGLPELCQRGGHIPGAHNVPWGEVCNSDGTFKEEPALRRLYAEHDVDGTRPVITYCRIGERSSHSWFVLRYLLGFEDVKNYDGSWTEWGNLIRAPIAR